MIIPILIQQASIAFIQFSTVFNFITYCPHYVFTYIPHITAAYWNLEVFTRFQLQAVLPERLNRAGVTNPICTLEKQRNNLDLSKLWFIPYWPE